MQNGVKLGVKVEQFKFESQNRTIAKLRGSKSNNCEA
jgi:hypothetical protein